MRYSFAGPSIEQAVLHQDAKSYDAAIASGHKDTYAPEAWEAKELDEEAEKTELRAKLKEAEIPFGPNTGIAKLRELVSAIPSK